MYEEIIGKIKTIIPDDAKAQEMFELITEDVFENLFSQLADISTDEELKTFETRLTEAKSPEHLQTMINEIAVTVYGDNYQEQIKSDYISLIEEMTKNIQQANDLISRSQNGDQAATELLKKAQQTDIYRSTVSNQ